MNHMLRLRGTVRAMAKQLRIVRERPLYRTLYRTAVQYSVLNCFQAGGVNSVHQLTSELSLWLMG